MKFHILGPLEAIGSDRSRVQLGGPKQRSVLALLLLEANQVVSTDRLVDELWGEDPPDTASHALQVYVSRLRKSFGVARDVITTQPPGYAIRIGEDGLDLLEFKRLLGRGKEALTRGDLHSASSSLDEALELWRGPALADLAFEPFAQSAISRLEELHAGAREEWVACELAVGRHSETIAELHAFAEAYPLRERIREQLMLALYRCGRQAEALEVYTDTRRLLLGELGIDPSASLTRLHEAILNQDPTLDLPSGILQSEATEDQAAKTTAEERRLITVLCADLASSAGLHDIHDPEEARAAFRGSFGILAPVIELFGGRVEDITASSLLSTFGVAEAHEDDPMRALDAALEMRRRLEAEARDLPNGHDIAPALRISLESGEVTAATRKQAVSGGPVTVASQLREVCRPGEILIGERIHRAAARRFSVRSVRRHAPDGSRVVGWRLDGAASSRGRPAIDLVGRRHELALMESLYRASYEGQPRSVLVIGDAGAGKTRFVEEFLTKLQPPQVMKGTCQPYGQEIAYRPLREALLQAADISFVDPAADVIPRLREYLQRAIADGPTAERVFNALSMAFGIEVPDNPLKGLAPSSIGDEIGLAWPALLGALSAERPLAVVLEDLHWAQQPLLELIERLLTRVAGKLLIVATARPELLERGPAWLSAPGLFQIRLSPLTDQESDALLRSLLPDAADTLRRKLAASAGGNPLFLEELTLHVRELRSDFDGDDTEVVLPDSVRGVLAARIDGLPADERRALQAASVVGRVFWPTTVSAVIGSEVPSEILRSLERRGLIVGKLSTSVPGEREFEINHPLIREVAYASVPTERRNEAHATVASWLERLAGARRNEFIELIAIHYATAAQAGDDSTRTRAINALIEAGYVARDRFDIDEAASFADRVLELADTDRESLRALELKALALHAGVRADDAWHTYLRALKVAIDIGDNVAVRRLRAHATLLWARYGGGFRGDGWKRNAHEIVVEGLADPGMDPEGFEAGCMLVGMSMFGFWGVAAIDPAEASRAGERALAIAEATEAASLMSYALDSFATASIDDGFCRSKQIADRILAFVPKIADKAESHELLVTASDILAGGGRFKKAEAIASEAQSQARSLSPHHALHAMSASASCFLPQGRLQELIDVASDAPQILEHEARDCFLGYWAVAALAAGRCETEGLGQADDLIELLLRVAPSSSTTWHWRYRSAEALLSLSPAAHELAVASTGNGDETTLQRVFRLRYELQHTATSNHWERFDAVAAEARSLARPACAPYLRWMADWGDSVRTATQGDYREASQAGIKAASSIRRFGERYTGARLVVDLLPHLDDTWRALAADEVMPHLEAMGAASSAERARLVGGIAP